MSDKLRSRETTNAYMRSSESLEDRVWVDCNPEGLAIFSLEFIQGPYCGMLDDLKDNRGSFSDLLSFGLRFPLRTVLRSNVYVCACTLWHDPHSYVGLLDEDCPHKSIICIIELLPWWGAMRVKELDRLL